MQRAHQSRRENVPPSAHVGTPAPWLLLVKPQANASTLQYICAVQVSRQGDLHGHEEVRIDKRPVVFAGQGQRHIPRDDALERPQTIGRIL